LGYELVSFSEFYPINCKSFRRRVTIFKGPNADDGKAVGGLKLVDEAAAGK
jgi:hypothetical protein